MASGRARSINPHVLVWARERAGLTLAEAAARLDKAVETLAAWEEGRDHPTYMQLEALAERVYKRPVAVFFLPEPPEEPAVRRQFRTLPESDAATLAPDTRYALREAQALQESLRELSRGKTPAAHLITRDINARPPNDVTRIATEARSYLGVSLEEQQSWSGPREAMTQWRDAVEQVGVFVFKRSFKQREVSGFCITDDQFPVIVVNNSTSFTRQMFTLLHELGHLLFGVNSIAKEDSHFLERFAPSDRMIEVACNRFAAEMLVPSESFPWPEFRAGSLAEAIARVAERYSVSREVILRRIHDEGMVSSEQYGAFVRAWAEQAEARSEGSGGNYYATQATYFGRAFLALALAQYRAGNVTLPQLAEHLGMKARNIAKLEDYLFARD